jgi:hypothetical protein
MVDFDLIGFQAGFKNSWQICAPIRDLMTSPQSAFNCFLYLPDVPLMNDLKGTPTNNTPTLLALGYSLWIINALARLLQ